MPTDVTKPLAQTLFWISCLLSVVSFYTTREGMGLYLSPWFSYSAALGVQLALVIVAWLFGAAGEGGRRRVVLAGVYGITAVISIAFSYVSLNTWFSERERPAMLQRKLYDELNTIAGRTEALLADAVTNGRRYTLALEEMAVAEKQHGHISKSRDAEPYLDAIREAVAHEAQSVGGAYKEGSGEGVRYSAFSRHAELTRQTTAAIESAQQSIARAKSSLKPDMPTEVQLRSFRQAYDAVPWSPVARMSGRAEADHIPLPTYSEFAEQAGSGQEVLMRSFEELFGNPSARNIFSLALAAFIDIIVFLLAYSAGPYLHGEAGQRWQAASAALDAHDRQIFARDLLRKVRAGRQGLPRVDAAELTPGELQLCLLLANHGEAVWHEDDGGNSYYLLDPATHRRLAESLAAPALTLRASAAAVRS